MKFSKIISSLSLALLIPIGSVSLIGCTKDEPNEDDCIIEAGASEVKINMNVNTSLFSHKDIQITDSATRSSADFRLHYYVSAYRLLNGHLGKEYAKYSSADPSFTIKLPLGKFRIYTWSQYVDINDSTSAGYFYTDDFKDMLLRGKLSYKGCDDHKMGFTAYKDITVSYKTPEVKLDLSPITGQFRIKATDTPDYTVGKILIGYLNQIPSSFDVVNDRICHYWSGMSFKACSELSDCIAFDNMIAEDEEQISIRIEVFDTDGKLRARRRKIEFPVKRGGITTVSAKIYSLLEPADGFIDDGDGGINENFDNTFHIGITSD